MSSGSNEWPCFASEMCVRQDQEWRWRRLPHGQSSWNAHLAFVWDFGHEDRFIEKTALFHRDSSSFQPLSKQHQPHLGSCLSGATSTLRNSHVAPLPRTAAGGSLPFGLISSLFIFVLLKTSLSAAQIKDQKQCVVTGEAAHGNACFSRQSAVTQAVQRPKTQIDTERRMLQRYHAECR
ncbi:hypothetical protein IF2G_04224 [Cordyceps javanica]|nr:hypothetical protein IF2G_04224 [Cordyceps javanica]